MLCVPPIEVRELRSLIRHGMTLVRDRTRVKNRVHTLLDKYELEGFSGTDLFGKAGMAWLREIGADLSKVDHMILDACIREVVVLNQLIDEADLKIAEESIESEDVRLLMTIPGVDFYTALLFVSEIGDISRFASSSKLVSWLGLAPRVHQSGDTGYHGRITKEGSPRVRWALVQAAQVAVRWDEHFAEKYHRIKSRRGAGKAIVVVAREIAVTMYHMLLRREPYRFSSKAFAARKYKRLEGIVKNAGRIMGRAPARGSFS